jgi:exodeoxyribonuclease VII small subunit
VSNTQPSYEQAIDKLRTIVSQLESGQQGLEESLSLFEEGIQLTRFCDTRLQTIEERVQMLLSQHQGVTQ